MEYMVQFHTFQTTKHVPVTGLQFFNCELDET